MQEVEKTIRELGGIFNRLAVMLGEQGEMVERIDDNVEDTLDNLEVGNDGVAGYFVDSYLTTSLSFIIRLELNNFRKLFLVFVQIECC